MILLDTHVLLWLLEEDDQLGNRARERVVGEQGGGGVLIPAIAFWEVAMLASKNRVRIGRDPRDFAREVLAMPGVRDVPVDAAIAADAGSLPGGIHGDPSDRMIVATARSLGCSVLTADEKILRYAAAGHVRAEDARR